MMSWKYLENLSVSAIAKRLGLGYKATESRLSRARQAFRRDVRDVAAGCQRRVTVRTRRAGNVGIHGVVAVQGRIDEGNVIGIHHSGVTEAAVSGCRMRNAR